MKYLAIVFLVSIALSHIQKAVVNSILTFQETSDVMDLISKQTKTKIKVKVNEPFRIEIASGPTTGFQWTLGKEKPELITHIDKETVGEVKSQETVLAGAPTTQIFTFIPNEKGTDKLFLVYRRSWESYNEDTTYLIKVIIE